jgi:hypothetical protein
MSTNIDEISHASNEAKRGGRVETYGGGVGTGMGSFVLWIAKLTGAGCNETKWAEHH